MSDRSEEPTDEVETLLKSERRRQGRERAGTLVMVAGILVGALGLMLNRAGLPETASSTALGLALVLSLGGALFTLAWKPGPSARRLEGLIGRRDRLQRSRNDRIYATSVTGWGMVAISLSPLFRIAQGQADGADFGFVTAATLSPMLLTISVAGWGGLAGLHRRWLEDELTRDIRRRALSLGFIVLMSGMTALFLLGLWKPAWGLMVFPAALMLSASVAGLRFVWLDQQAEGGVDG